MFMPDQLVQLALKHKIKLGRCGITGKFYIRDSELPEIPNDLGLGNDIAAISDNNTNVSGIIMVYRYINKKQLTKGDNYAAN